MIAVVRNKFNGIAYDMATHRHLLEEKPDTYGKYFLQEPGDPPFDHFTGIPLDAAPVVEPATEGATANGATKDREEKILDAVMSIDPENYGKPAGGRPALPKKAAVEYLTGFKVTLEEIEKAVALKEALGEPVKQATEEEVPEA